MEAKNRVITDEFFTDRYEVTRDSVKQLTEMYEKMRSAYSYGHGIRSSAWFLVKLIADTLEEVNKFITTYETNSVDLAGEVARRELRLAIENNENIRNHIVENLPHHDIPEFESVEDVNKFLLSLDDSDLEAINTYPGEPYESSCGWFIDTHSSTPKVGGWATVYDLDPNMNDHIEVYEY